MQFRMYLDSVLRILLLSGSSFLLFKSDQNLKKIVPMQKSCLTRCKLRLVFI